MVYCYLIATVKIVVAVINFVSKGVRRLLSSRLLQCVFPQFYECIQRSRLIYVYVTCEYRLLISKSVWSFPNIHAVISWTKNTAYCYLFIYSLGLALTLKQDSSHLLLMHLTYVYKYRNTTFCIDRTLYVEDT